MHRVPRGAEAMSRLYARRAHKADAGPSARAERCFRRYDIGGELTSVLSLTCSKKLPMIPHVGVRLHGTEYFYSDVIESRPVDVMREMLEDFPQAAGGVFSSKLGMLRAFPRRASRKPMASICLVSRPPLDARTLEGRPSS